MNVNASHADTTAAGAPEGLPGFRFALEQQPAKTGHGGSAREASADHFPVSKGIAGVSMRLAPGSMRELHWHANAAEWAYVESGHCRITIYGPDGAKDVADFGPGDVWYFPRGHGHSIQGLGPGDCHFVLIFDNGYFSEFATFSFSDWLAHTPKEVLAKNLHVPESTFDTFPKSEVYFAQGPVPPPLPAPRRGAPLPPHKYRLEAQQPRLFHGGTVRLVSAREFPISKTMTGAIMRLERGALRELHWHPNADEWQYVLAGRMRMTVFASSGRAETVELSQGDVGYVPQGYGHYLENIGNDECRMLLAFNSGEYQEIGLTGWIASNPQLLVATNLGVPEKVVAEFPKQTVFIAD
ncbi:MAG: cupin domain-containing protein [Pirellulales bacterium]